MHYLSKRKSIAVLLVFAVIFSLVLGPLQLSLTPQAYASFSNVFESDTTINLPFQTGTVTPDKSFTSYVVSWSEEEAHDQHDAGEIEEDHIIFFTRTYTGSGWGEWEELAKDHDTSDHITGKNYTGITFTEPASKIQLVAERGSIKESLDLTYLEIITFGEHETPSLSFSNVTNAESSPNIVSREMWGASNDWIFFDTWNVARDKVCAEQPWYCGSSASAQEAIRKKIASEQQKYPEDTKQVKSIESVGGRDLVWSVGKSAKVKKLFVHHTANINKDQNGDGIINKEDEMIALRSIYYFHSVVRGWGDIGYNFLVGPSGTIYEGRYGGDYAVGAHAVWRNASSIGVSLLGNFEQESFGNAQLQGTAKALAYLSHKYGLDPSGETYFYGLTQPTIIGHRDSAEASTACPGKNVYVSLEEIRKAAKQYYDGMTGVDSAEGGIGSSAGYSASYIPVLETLKLNAGERGTVQIKLRNTGENTWDASTYLRVDNGEPGFTILSGKGTRAIAAYAKDLITPPGETAIFELEVQNTYEGFTGNINLTPFGGGLYAMPSFSIPVQLSKGSASYEQQSVVLSPNSPMIGEDVRITGSVKNTGTSTWEKSGVRPFYVTVYDANNATNPVLDNVPLQEDSVAPGQVGTFVFTIPATLTPNVATYNVIPRIQGISAFLGSPIVINMSTLDPVRAGVVLTPSITTPYSLNSGSTQEITIPITNTSTKELKQTSRYMLSGTLSGTDSSFYTIGVPYILEENIKPNQKGTLVVPVTAKAERPQQSYELNITIGGITLLRPTIDLRIRPLVLTGEVRYKNITTDLGQKQVILAVQNTGSGQWSTRELQSNLIIDTEPLPLRIMSMDLEIRPGEWLYLMTPELSSIKEYNGTLTIRHNSGAWVKLVDDQIKITMRNLQDYLPGLRYFFGK